MYKDKDKQREAVRLATQRYRAKVSPIVSHKVSPNTDTVIPSPVRPKLDVAVCDVKPQSHSPMAIGYVPKKD